MSEPLRIGMIGLDTSHVVAFTKLLNDPAQEHHVPGARVVAAFPGGSPDFPLSINRVEGFTKTLREEWGVKILGSPAEVAEAVDVVFIESVDGRVHLQQFKETVAARRPTFIDKPLTVKSGEAREIFRLAREAGVPVLSASGLRFDEQLAAALNDSSKGKVLGCDVYGPMSIEPTQPGLFWYGIHSVEVVSRAMGTGCRKVQTDSNDNVDVVTATWADGRVAVIRGNRNSHHQFGVVLHREQGAQWLDLSATRTPWYASMLKAVMDSFTGGELAIQPEASIEVIRLIEAANESRENGQVVAL